MELVKNLLTDWNSGGNENGRIDELIKKVQRSARRFAESPILVNMLCHLYQDDESLEDLNLVDIYEKVCDKLLDQYLRKVGIHNNLNDYRKVYGFVMRITAYLMHRL